MLTQKHFLKNKTTRFIILALFAIILYILRVKNLSSQSKLTISNIFLPLLLAIIILIHCQAISHASDKQDELLDFSLFRLGTNEPVMLIIGGIQGDEPGGFSAATLMATRYTVSQGALWIVPNLNFPSIIKRSRGVHGDMNRKFASLSDTDPQYTTVCRIQELIRAKEVDIILNLHDGSGFYRPKYKDKLHGPHRWGQSVIIDQEFMPDYDPQNKLYADILDTERLQFLGHIAKDVTNYVNERLLNKNHYLEVHNTHTAAGDIEMEKSLSWFAVRHGKPAFGLEASKEFSVTERTYYHLQMIEAFAKLANIKIERDFPLTLKGVGEALYTGLSVSFMDGRIMLPLEDVRSRINYLPLPKENYKAIASKPIMAVLPKAKNLQVHYGNRTLTSIMPDWHEIDTSLNTVLVVIDGKERQVNFGSIVSVNKDFKVLSLADYRINAIGADTGKANESDVLLTKKSFIRKFSVDNGGSIFRVEVYRGKKFCGMFLVRFDN